MKSNSIALICRIEKLDKRIMCITVCIVCQLWKPYNYCIS